jgi:magnesium transporter
LPLAGFTAAIRAVPRASRPGRRWTIVALLPPLLRRELREPLGYEPKTAGGLMNPKVLCLYDDITTEDALEHDERSPLPDQVLTTIYVASRRGRLRGSVMLAGLLRAPSGGTSQRDRRRAPAHVTADADLKELA